MKSSFLSNIHYEQWKPHFLLPFLLSSLQKCYQMSHTCSPWCKSCSFLRLLLHSRLTHSWWGSGWGQLTKEALRSQTTGRPDGWKPFQWRISSGLGQGRLKPRLDKHRLLCRKNKIAPWVHLTTCIILLAGPVQRQLCQHETTNSHLGFTFSCPSG